MDIAASVQERETRQLSHLATSVDAVFAIVLVVMVLALPYPSELLDPYAIGLGVDFPEDPHALALQSALACLVGLAAAGGWCYPAFTCRGGDAMGAPWIALCFHASTIRPICS